VIRYESGLKRQLEYNENLGDLPEDFTQEDYENFFKEADND